MGGLKSVTSSGVGLDLILKQLGNGKNKVEGGTLIKSCISLAVLSQNPFPLFQENTNNKKNNKRTQQKDS